jgi:hypothetical protein
MWFLERGQYKDSSLDSMEESKEQLLEPEGSVQRSPRITNVRLHLIGALLHIVIAVMWTSTFWAFAPLCKAQPPSGLRPHEFGKGNAPKSGLSLTSQTAPVAEAIEYTTVTFDVSGGGTRENPITPFEGPPTPEKDMKWWELANGMCAHLSSGTIC